jgi:hypothetical protein
MAKSKLSESEKVDELIAKLSPLEVRETILAIRETVLCINPEIGEQVKWNSPCFYYAGEMKPFDPKEYKRDIVVCNVHRGNILLVFPTGAKVKSELKGKDYPDGRKIVTIEDINDFKNKALLIKQLIKDWLLLIEK